MHRLIDERIGECLDGRSVLEFLNTRHFSASEVCHAASITADGLTNLISKSRINLFSDPPGSGRSRQFCLIDVYQVAIIATMGQLLGHVRHISDFLTKKEIARWDEANSVPSGSYTFNPGRVCKDIRRAHPLYFHRDERSPFYIALLVDLPHGFVMSRDEPGQQYRSSARTVLDVTMLLGDVDSRLIVPIFREAESGA